MKQGQHLVEPDAFAERPAESARVAKEQGNIKKGIKKPIFHGETLSVKNGGDIPLVGVEPTVFRLRV